MCVVQYTTHTSHSHGEMVGRWSAMESVTYLISSWFKFKFLLQPLKCVCLCILWGSLWVCLFFISQTIWSMEYNFDLKHFRSHSMYIHSHLGWGWMRLFNYIFFCIDVKILEKNKIKMPRASQFIKISSLHSHTDVVQQIEF